MKYQRILFGAVALLLGSCIRPEKKLGTEARLYLNLRGYTFTGDSLTTFTGLVTDSGKVIACGDAAELSLRYKGTEVVDLGGKTILPGLIDAHGHVLGLGHLRRQVDLVGTASLTQAMARVESFIRENPGSGWVLGRGWNQELWTEQRYPTAVDLDAIAPTRPIYLARVDGHAAIANTRALQLAGITGYTPNPVGGKIERDRNGRPTGLLIDRATELVEKFIPQPTYTDDSLALAVALYEFRSLGLTGVHDAGITPQTYRLYKSFADAGLLTTRLYAMIGGADSSFWQISRAGILPSYAADRLSVRSVKLYADGALGSRGAYLLAPYSDDPTNRGLAFYSPDSMTAMIRRCAERGYQVNVHAIGDGGNRQVLDAFVAVNATVPGTALRHRIEHAQVVSPADFPRFKTLGLIASLQPTHATSDKNMAEDRLGPERLQGAYAWQTFLQQRTVVAAGSDFPVESANPFLGLFAAVTRQDTSGTPAGGWLPNQRLTRTQALRAFTLDAAYAAHQEGVLGNIAPGKWADFIVIDRDYMACPDEEIWQIQVLQTFLAGKLVYEKQAE